MADVNGFQWYARLLAELEQAHINEARQTMAVEDHKRIAQQQAETLKATLARINELEGDMQNGSINPAKIEALVSAHIEREQWSQAITANNAAMANANSILINIQKGMLAKAKELAEAARAEAKWRMEQDGALAVTLGHPTW